MALSVKSITCCCYLVFASSLVGWAAGQKRPLDFECPKQFGYYPEPNDVTRYYVCVSGGALLESCTGGLVYSHELQTCDWPRNNVSKYRTGAKSNINQSKKSAQAIQADQKRNNFPLSQLLLNKMRMHHQS